MNRKSPSLKNRPPADPSQSRISARIQTFSLQPRGIPDALTPVSFTDITFPELAAPPVISAMATHPVSLTHRKPDIITISINFLATTRNFRLAYRQLISLISLREMLRINTVGRNI